MVPLQSTISGRTSASITSELEDLITTDRLRPGESLPPVRTLAADLGVAPGTVAAAYRALRDRGFVETQGRNGTVVRAPFAGSARSTPPTALAGLVDLSDGQPDAALLPCVPTLSPDRRATAPALPVIPELVQLARRRLARDAVPSEALTLTGGCQDALDRLLSLHLRPGDIVAVEDPGWPNLLDLVAALGLRAHPLAVDAEGPVPESLDRALRAGVRTVIVTCRAQNPTGAFVTPARQSVLRTILADHPSTLVIEDDHAAELAGVASAPLAAATSSWAFIRSVSKPYGPDLRLAVVAGDRRTISRLEARMATGIGWVSTLLQDQVVALWKGADAEIQLAAASYGRRRQRLLAALADRGVPATGASGVNIWVPVADETAVVLTLADRGWLVAPGARFRQQSAAGIRITISGLTDATTTRFADDLLFAVTASPSARRST